MKDIIVTSLYHSIVDFVLNKSCCQSWRDWFKDNTTWSFSFIKKEAWTGSSLFFGTVISI